jgi:hypothetical protein
MHEQPFVPGTREDAYGREGSQAPLSEKQPHGVRELPEDNSSDEQQAALLALFRLLSREPPADHDFKTCETCKKYGITGI